LSAYDIENMKSSEMIKKVHLNIKSMKEVLKSHLEE